MEISVLVIFPLLGLLAGIMAGLFGVGGGLIIVPVLAWVFRHQGIDESIIMHLAIGSSLATIVVTSLGSMRAHHKRGSVAWEILLWITPGIVAGALAGAWLADQFSTLWLQRFVAISIIAVGLQMATNVSVKAHRNLPGSKSLSLSGGLIGMISSMAGIGGGSLTVPYLVWHNMPMTRAIGTAAACGLPIALAGSIGFALTGTGAITTEFSYTTGYLYWPAILGISIVSYLVAPVGAYLAHRLPVKILKRLFALLLVIIGFYLF